MRRVAVVLSISVFLVALFGVFMRGQRQVRLRSSIVEEFKKGGMGSDSFDSPMPTTTEPEVLPSLVAALPTQDVEAAVNVPEEPFDLQKSFESLAPPFLSWENLDHVERTVLKQHDWRRLYIRAADGTLFYCWCKASQPTAQDADNTEFVGLITVELYERLLEYRLEALRTGEHCTRFTSEADRGDFLRAHQQRINNEPRYETEQTDSTFVVIDREPLLSSAEYMERAKLRQELREASQVGHGGFSYTPE